MSIAEDSPQASRLLDVACPADVALSHLLRGELVRAEVAVTRALGAVPEAWAMLHPLAISAKHVTLQSVQRLVDM